MSEIGLGIPGVCVELTLSMMIDFFLTKKFCVDLFYDFITFLSFFAFLIQRCLPFDTLCMQTTSRRGVYCTFWLLKLISCFIKKQLIIHEHTSEGGTKREGASVIFFNIEQN